MAAARILVVDDSGEILDILTRFFTNEGHEVRVAADGKQGLAQLREWEPQVMLLDLQMPEMNGLDVLRNIQAHYAQVAVIAFSGHSAAEQLGGDAKRLGATDFLAKPFDLGELGALVTSVLNEANA